MLAIGSPMPARAIKLLKDPGWRATPLYTLLSQAGKKTCFMSELLNRRAATAAQIPGERAGPESGGQDWKGGQRQAAERERRDGLWETFKRVA